MRRTVPIVFGVGGAAILIGLGVWQLQRMGEKEAFLAQIEARIGGDTVALPETNEARADRFLPVRAEGRTSANPIAVLTSRKGDGAGYRLITRFETGGRIVLVDLGFAKMKDAAAADVTVVGNLHHPDEVDSFTPDPDPGSGLWFARDVPSMAEFLGTEPVLIVARSVEPPLPGVAPWPVDTEGIPNDHLEYALTWFSLAVVWLGMTAFWLRRNRGGTNGTD